MLELLNGSGDLADQANQVTKHAQAVTAEALEASKEVNNWHNHLRELVIKLQRSHERTRSRRSSAESQAIPDLATDQRADSAEEGQSQPDMNHQKRALDGEANEPVGSLAVTPTWITQTRLQNQWAMATQCIGQLYEANADPAVLNEAVA
jgi:hypothetical protein